MNVDPTKNRVEADGVTTAGAAAAAATGAAAAAAGAAAAGRPSPARKSSPSAALAITPRRTRSSDSINNSIFEKINALLSNSMNLGHIGQTGGIGVAGSRGSSANASDSGNDDGTGVGGRLSSGSSAGSAGITFGSAGTAFGSAGTAFGSAGSAPETGSRRGPESAIDSGTESSRISPLIGRSPAGISPLIGRSSAAAAAAVAANPMHRTLSDGDEGSVKPRAVPSVSVAAACNSFSSSDEEISDEDGDGDVFFFLGGGDESPDDRQDEDALKTPPRKTRAAANGEAAQVTAEKPSVTLAKLRALWADVKRRSTTTDAAAAAETDAAAAAETDADAAVAAVVAADIGPIRKSGRKRTLRSAEPHAIIRGDIISVGATTPMTPAAAANDSQSARATKTSQPISATEESSSTEVRAVGRVDDGVDEGKKSSAAASGRDVGFGYVPFFPTAVARGEDELLRAGVPSCGDCLPDSAEIDFASYLPTSPSSLLFGGSGVTVDPTNGALMRSRNEGSSIFFKFPSVLHPLHSSAADSSLETAARLHRNGTMTNDATVSWSGQLPQRNPKKTAVSCKVFLGGVPWDISEAAVHKAFRPFGKVTIQWPGSRNVLSKGYLYLVFEDEKHVKSLLSECSYDYGNGGSWYFKVSSRRMKNKEVQVIPWIISDCNFVRFPSRRLDPQLTVFVGAMHGMINAEGLSNIFNSLFGGVVYAGIDTDRYQYPIGSGRVTFNNVRSFIKAVSAAFIEIKTPRFIKKIQVDPYLEDVLCSFCCLRQGPYFCRDLSCFKYFCRSCWEANHMDQAVQHHKPLMRKTKTPGFRRVRNYYGGGGGAHDKTGGSAGAAAAAGAPRKKE